MFLFTILDRYAWNVQFQFVKLFGIQIDSGSTAFISYNLNALILNIKSVDCSAANNTENSFSFPFLVSMQQNRDVNIGFRKNRRKNVHRGCETIRSKRPIDVKF